MTRTSRLNRPKQSRAKKRPSTVRIQNKPSLLIIECDSPKLQSQGLSCVDEIQVTSQLWADTVVVKGGSQSELCRDLGNLANRRFEYILVIGHSNIKGIVLMSDRPPVLWADFSSWIVDFKPKKIVLIACDAGRYLTFAALFAQIPTLREVYGSPIRAGKNLAKAMHILLPILYNAKAEDSPGVRITQLYTWLITKEVLFRYTRQGVNDVAHDPSALLFTSLLESCYPDMFAAFREWLIRVREEDDQS